MESTSYVCFAAGAQKGVLFEGFLQVLEDRWTPQELDTWRAKIQGLAGSSVGSIVALIFALGFSRTHRLEFAREMFTFKTMLHPDVTLLASRFGWDEGHVLKDFVQKILTRGGLSHTSTLGDLKRLLRIEFVVPATDLKTMSPIVFSSTTTPDLMVCDTIYASCAIPFLFTPAVINGHMCVDACMSCALPTPFPEEKTLFLNIACSEESDTMPKDWPDYIRRVLSCSGKVQEACNYRHIHERNTERFLNFDASQNVVQLGPEDMESFLRNGYNTTLNHLLKNSLLENICETVRIYVQIMSCHVVAVSTEEEPPH